MNSRSTDSQPEDTSAATIAATDSYTLPNYARFPVVFVRGEGARLYDAAGKAYLDLLSGLGVSALGHGHPAVVRAIKEQSEALLHSSNLYYNEPGAALAAELVRLSFADRVFFCNSGTEANEAAIKMARRFQGGRHEIVCVHGSFHGRTLAALAATGQPNLHEGFAPMPAGFVHVAHDSVAAAAEAIGPQTAAVMVEPILGEGGVITPHRDYLGQLRRLCDENDILLILDEVQTGNGRTGKLYAHEHFGIAPDIMTTAKGLAGGLPIGAVLATERVAACMVPGTHGSTFGANPVVCAAALAVLHELVAGGVIDNVVRVSTALRARLDSLCKQRSDIVGVRGLGLMVGIELDRPAKPVVEAMLAAGVVANATAGNIVRMLPPLTISAAELDEGIDTLLKVLG